MTKVLALDFGKLCGWCVIEFEDLSSYQNDSDLYVDLSSLEIGHQAFEGEESDIFLAFMRWLDPMLDGVHSLIFEEVRFNRNFSYIPFMMAYTQAECVRRHISFVGVNVSSLKTWSREHTKYGRSLEKGNRQMSKSDMLSAAHEKLALVGGDGFIPLTDDEADAFLIMMWGLENVI